MSTRPLPPIDFDAARLVALVDESYRAVSGGQYVMAAAVFARSEIEHVRARVAAVAARRGRRPFHWVDEDSVDRSRMIEVVAELPLTHLVVVAAPVDRRRQVRSRAMCLKHLMPSLQDRGVEHVVFESRASQDAEDRKVIGGLRRGRLVPRSLGYSFKGKSEHVLWVPDSVAGAMTAARCDGQDRFLKTLGSRVTIIEITGDGILAGNA